jgi:RHS repeat-associated protein
VANSWEFGSGYYGASTGLVKLGQRFYDASLGRWTQQDPVPSGNLYLYTGDNPVNFVDPSGEFGIGDVGGAFQTFGETLGVIGTTEAVIGGGFVAASPVCGPGCALVGGGFALLGAGTVATGAQYYEIGTVLQGIDQLT